MASARSCLLVITLSPGTDSNASTKLRSVIAAIGLRVMLSMHATTVLRAESAVATGVLQVFASRIWFNSLREPLA